MALKLVTTQKLDSIRMLIVDDDDVERESIVRSLRSTLSRDNIVQVATANRGYEEFQASTFNVVLIDFWLPQVNGIDMLKHLRDMSNFGNTAIVMMSVSEDEQLAIDCLEAGAHDFITKNEINPARIRRAILLARKRFELEKELHKSYLRVKDIAEHDNLTGLSNRYDFEERLQRAIDNSQRDSHRIALLFFDLDHFKYINDTYGHIVGDMLLKEVVQRVETCLRRTECFARLGGDEFAIVLNDFTAIADVSRVAHRILSVFESSFQVLEHDVRASASIGITFCPDNSQTVQAMIQQADIAMYRAKHQGRNKACFFEEKMQQEITQRFMLEKELRSAIINNSVELYYQPVICPTTEKLLGFEALVRWCNNGQYISPEQFIPIAEESRIIIELGHWIIQTACCQLREWQQKYQKTLTMAINLSPIQLEDFDIVKRIRRCLERYSLAPESVELELTETALFGSNSQKIGVIEKLSELGCHIALDDFGTGYSSISHILQFPINSVKIDRSLMPKEGGKSRHLSVLTALSEMLHSLEYTVIAEGLETQEHRVTCERLNIAKAQGFYWSAALPACEIEDRWLSKLISRSENN